MVEIVLASAHEVNPCNRFSILTCPQYQPVVTVGIPLCIIIHMAAYKNWLTNTDGSIGGTRVDHHIGVTGMQHNHKRLYSLLHCSVIHDHYGDTRPVWVWVECNLMWRIYEVLTSWNTNGMCITIRAERNVTLNSGYPDENLFVDNSISLEHTKRALSSSRLHSQ